MSADGILTLVSDRQILHGCDSEAIVELPSILAASAFWLVESSGGTDNDMVRDG